MTDITKDKTNDYIKPEKGIHTARLNEIKDDVCNWIKEIGWKPKKIFVEKLGWEDGNPMSYHNFYMWAKRNFKKVTSKNFDNKTNLKLEKLEIENKLYKKHADDLFQLLKLAVKSGNKNFIELVSDKIKNNKNDDNAIDNVNNNVIDTTKKQHKINSGKQQKTTNNNIAKSSLAAPSGNLEKLHKKEKKKSIVQHCYDDEKMTELLSPAG